MSSARWLVVLLWAAGPAALCAQRLERLSVDTDGLAEPVRLTPLRARADSLLREWRRANALADVVAGADRVRAGAASDTIRIGALTIVTNPSPLPLREAAARAWPVIDSLYGVEAWQLRQHPYLIIAFDPDTTVELPVVRTGLAVPWDLDARALALLLLANVPRLPADPALEAWLGGSMRPSLGPEHQRARVYVELVTAPSEAARSCFLRDIESCRYALDLVESPDRFLSWYRSPEERRAVVARFLSSLNRGAQGRTFHACMAGSDSGCIRLLRSVPEPTLPRPLAYHGRKTLVDLALQLGGPPGYQRLLASPEAPIAHRLAAAAGVGIDSLVARWRAEVLASRPAPVALPAWGFWIAIGWTALFAACGLRSSRWRVS